MSTSTVVKRGRKKKETVESPVSNSKSNLQQAIDASLKVPYKLTVNPQHWVLPNRVKFPNWIDKTFTYKNMKKYPKCMECEEGESCSIKVNSLSLFPYQDFIKDYIQFASPYRGLLVMHGLGTGKTCSSIAAAEMLSNNMDVVVMVMASLKDNYINEIKKCGRTFFNTKQHWVFSKDEQIVNKVCEKLKVSKEFAKKQKGIWIPLPDAAPNFSSLPQEHQEQINAQINDSITNRFTFINHNGLRQTHIDKMTMDGTVNPFDNKAIIIDEIHNVISKVVNNRRISSTLYNLLLKAKNCKIILLSGTPIINYPYEIAFVINLLTGPLKYYEVRANKNSAFDRTAIENELLANKYVDDFTIDISQRTVTIFLVPEGFYIGNRENSVIKRYSGEVRAHDTIIAEIASILESRLGMNLSKRTYTKETTTLPTSKDDFNMLFVDEQQGLIRNPKLFMKRILGTVSYYNAYSPELFPSKTIHEVKVPMNAFQFALYEKTRSEERDKESSITSRFGKKKASNSESSGQVYRFFTRAICNFVFPDKIKRTFPSKISYILKELDVDEDQTNDIEDGEHDTKAVLRKKYEEELAKTLATLYEQKDEYLHMSRIGKLSPKFERVLQNIATSPGNVLVYSQFRNVEGLGVLGMALEANGWAKFKIVQKNGEWIIDEKEEDINKPKYTTFTGNNEESRIILKIFNNDFDNLPPKITEALKGKNNIHGDVVRLITITQSGAEGISLKNTRQVHILEPYWNHIRMDQVIGRAVRTCSHTDLPKDEQNVEIFIYCASFTPEQTKASFTLRTLDKGLTSDEYLFSIAKRKKAVIDALTEMMQKASVDCTLNAQHHGIKCFSFPVNMDERKSLINQDISLEELDVSVDKNIEKKEWKGQLIRTKKGNFVIKEGTNEVYDYDMYMHSGKVVKIGTIVTEGEKRVIKVAH